MRLLYPLIPVALALIVGGTARAEGLVVMLNHSQRLNLSGAAANVVVGAPSIADVTVVDSHTLYVQGRGYGSTDIVVTDRQGRTIYSGEVTVGVPGRSVALYRGVKRADYACAPACSEDHGSAPVSPVSALFGNLLGGAAANPLPGLPTAPH